MTEREVTDLIVIHCADTKPSMDHINEDEIRQWHMDKGWVDAGYNVVIPRRPKSDQHGMIEIARPLDARGAHVAGYNHRALGICLVGGMSEAGEPEDNFLPIQMHALKIAMGFLLTYAPTAVVVGHRDLNSSKTCPCFYAQLWAVQNCFPIPKH